MPRPTLASLLEDFRNWNKTQDWMLNKQRDIYGNEDPDTIALNEKLAGIGTADMGMLGSSVSGLAGALASWHGSPNKFNVMDFARAGETTGQQYGYGGYLSSGPEVAKKYTPRDFGTEHKLMDLYNRYIKQNKYGAAEILEDYLSHQTPQTMEKKLELLRSEYSAPDASQKSLLQEMEEAHSKAADLFRKQKGSHLYETSFEWPTAEQELATPLTEAHLMNWEGRLSEQSPNVQKAISEISRQAMPSLGERGKSIASLLESDPYAGTWYGLMSSKISPKSLSENLSLQGVPGARYMDMEQRIPNYVVYDPRSVKLLSRNAISLTDLLRR